MAIEKGYIKICIPTVGIIGGEIMARNKYPEQTLEQLFQYIEGLYNRKRIHSSINYMTPDAYEQICRTA